MADHEHRAYEVWDGASRSDISYLESLIAGLREDLGYAENRIRQLEQALGEHVREGGHDGIQ